MVCAGGAASALEMLSLCCFLLYRGRSSEWRLRGLALSFSVCVGACQEPLVKAEKFKLEGFGPPCGT